jgi:hypothetical protein
VTTHRQPSASSPSDGKGDLARLLETERRLEEIVAGARDEAAALVTRAREDAAAREAAVATEFAGALREIEAGIAAERQRREGELAETMGAEARRFDAIGAERVDALAHYVIARVIGVEP